MIFLRDHVCPIDFHQLNVDHLAIFNSGKCLFYVPNVISDMLTEHHGESPISVMINIMPASVTRQLGSNSTFLAKEILYTRLLDFAGTSIL